MQDLNVLNVRELYTLAKQNKIKNYKKFRKLELVEVLSKVITPIEVNSIAVRQESNSKKVVEIKKDNKIVNHFEKPLNFKFDSKRANINDEFKKRIGDDYISMRVVEKCDNSVTMQSRNGIKVKVRKW